MQVNKCHIVWYLQGAGIERLEEGVTLYLNFSLMGAPSISGKFNYENSSTSRLSAKLILLLYFFEYKKIKEFEQKLEARVEFSFLRFILTLSQEVGHTKN